MTSVTDCFKNLSDRKQCALIPFITAGDPDLETTAAALRVLDKNGADLIELGVPYSDPLADGPTIHEAATRALQKGVCLDDVLQVVKEVGGELRSPIILFTYYNPIFYRGVEPFLKQIAEAGVKGLIVPDLPLEEAQIILKNSTDLGIELTLLVAPTSPKERMKAIAENSQGFIYLVSVTGTTGEGEAVCHFCTLHFKLCLENLAFPLVSLIYLQKWDAPATVEELLSDLRSVTDKPIGVGFGISEPEQAKQVKEWGADAIIVGSAIVKRLAKGTPAEGLAEIGQFTRSLKQAIS